MGLVLLRILIGFNLISALVTFIKGFQTFIQAFDLFSVILIAIISLSISYYAGTFVV